METLIAIAMLALSLFGPGWSSPKKAYWEWQLGHPLQGYEEHRLARGEWNPYGNHSPSSSNASQFLKCNVACVLGGECIISDCQPISK